MRNYEEMMNTILTTANQHDSIRAVFMNGSRANPNVTPDIFQDYDIVYVVEETTPFIHDEDWMLPFGKPCLIQKVEQIDIACGKPCDIEQEYTYLMLFEDHNRIDLKLYSIEKAQQEYDATNMCIVLVDKDQRFPQKTLSDKEFWIQKPSHARYFAVCNDFWWCLQNVAKGIARDELPYAKWMFDDIVRGCLHSMIEWYIGCIHNYQISTGKEGKYFKKLLPCTYWEIYMKTYCDATYDAFWISIQHTCDLFHTMAVEVAKFCSFSYIQKDEDHMRAYLQYVKSLNRLD